MDELPRLISLYLRITVIRWIIAYRFICLLQSPTLARLSFCMVVRLIGLFLLSRTPLYLSGNPIRCGWNMVLNLVRLQCLICTSVFYIYVIEPARHLSNPSE